MLGDVVREVVAWTRQFPDEHSCALSTDQRAVLALERPATVTCDFGHEDGAYVVGALGPAKRLAFEQHLAGCPDCVRSVRELAGLPGLLARIDPSVLEDSPVADPVPVATTARPVVTGVAPRPCRGLVLVTAGLVAAATAAFVRWRLRTPRQ
jgi:anti-sigma factor RsiW